MAEITIPNDDVDHEDMIETLQALMHGQDNSRFLHARSENDPLCIPLDQKTAPTEDKQDYLLWNQPIDNTLYDAGGQMEALLAELYAEAPFTGARVIVSGGFYNILTPGDPANRGLVNLRARQTLSGLTGNYAAEGIIRDKDANGHLIYCVPGTAGEGSEFRNASILNLWLDGGANGVQGPSVDDDLDIIHCVKPTNGAWGDTKLNVRGTRLSNAIRHSFYYSARGDTHFDYNFSGRSGDSAVVWEGAVDVYMNTDLLVSAGRHALVFKDSTNLEATSVIGYFCGSNLGSFWDGASAAAVRINGAAILLDNCESFRFLNGRVEDTSGGAVVASEAVGVVIDTYANNLGSLGSFADAAAGTKDFGNNGITASVEGVDVITFQRRGSRPSKNWQVDMRVRQARSVQNLRSLISFDPQNQEYRPFKDMRFNFVENSSSNVPNEKPIDDPAAWAAVGQTSFWEDHVLIKDNRNEPIWFENVEIRWNGELVPSLHDRIHNLRVENHNCWDERKRYQLNVAEVTANVSAVSWSSQQDFQRATLTVDADLTAALSKKRSIRLSGLTDPLLLGVFNVVAVTATTVTVAVRPDNSQIPLPNGTSGEIGLLQGPEGRLTLTQAVPGIEYCVEIMGGDDFDPLARPMTVVLANEVPSEVVLSAPGQYWFRHTPTTGWETFSR